MKPDGKVLGPIENVNFFEEGIEKVKEPTTGKMLNELESKSEVMADTVTNVCSMGKSKKGKVNPTKLSPASEKQKTEKKEKREKEVSKGKPKPEPKSGLGPEKKVTPAAQPSTRTSPRDPPPNLPTQNPRINPVTGIPYTTEAEKQAICELLERRGKRQDMPKEDSSSSEGMEAPMGIEPMISSEELEEEIETPAKKKRTSKDLVVKKRMGGGVSQKRKKSGKGATTASTKKGKKVPEKKVPSEVDSNRKHWGVGGKPSTTSQTGPGCYQTDEQGRIYDKCRRRVFVDDEAQTMGDTSDEEERAGDFSEEEDDDLGVQLLEAGVSMATSVKKVGRQV